MANPREHLEDWLRDAYAMERQAEMLLAAQLKRLDHYPQLQDRLRQHLDDTIGQQALVEACLMRLGTTPSAIRAWPRALPRTAGSRAACWPSTKW